MEPADLEAECGERAAEREKEEAELKRCKIEQKKKRAAEAEHQR